MPSPDRVLVIGAGVIGLSCAVRLAEAGLPVDVLARDLPPETTSAVAGGLWLPFLAEPAEAVARWSLRTLTELRALVASGADTGIAERTGYLLGEEDEPDWARAMDGAVPVERVSAPAPGHRVGLRMTVPLVDMGRYLPYLVGRLEAAGGTLTRMPVSVLPEAALVVNCTGLAARALAGDESMRPIRGQVVRVADPGLEHWWSGQQNGRLSYVLPHGRHVVVGGTSDRDDWSTTPDPATAERILAAAAELVPELAGARVLAHRVGLRPWRPAVRLETEVRPGRGGLGTRTVVHCYGHGGCGVTTSWGCADDVLAEVGALVG